MVSGGPVPLQILLADDHQMVREGLKMLLERAGFTVVGEASDGQEAVRRVRDLSPDVAVLDLAMPLLNGLDAAREISRVSPSTRPILLTMSQRRALRDGGAADRRQGVRPEDPGGPRPGSGDHGSVPRQDLPEPWYLPDCGRGGV